MMKNYRLYIWIVIVFLTLSTLVKIKVYSDNKELQAKRDEILKDKEIVTIWLKDDYDSETRKFQVREYNKYNKDNIYINLQIYDDDYINMLRTAVANNNKVDIFQYGFYQLFRYDRIMPMKDLGIDIDKIGKNNFLYYKKEPMGVKVLGNDVKFVWNKEILKGAGIDSGIQPKTWQDVIEYAKKIKKAYPDIIPFEFPAYYLEELRISIGEMSVNKGSIYTTFWDYKNGKFNFDYAKDILNIYRKMYAEGLIDVDFDKKTKIHVREDFANRKTAMILSTFEDKYFFEGIRPLKFDIGISDLPKINIGDSNNYYYTGTYKCLMVNKNVDLKEEEKNNNEKVKEKLKHKEAVKKVYEWLLSKNVNMDILAAKKGLPTCFKDKVVKNDIYKEYNKDDNFTNEIYDPTIFINYDINLTKNLFYDSIKGNISIEDAINKLNYSYAKYCKIMIDYYNFDFSKFIED